MVDSDIWQCINVNYTYNIYMEMKTTVGPKGQIIIPKEFRDKIGIKEYSEVIVDVVDDSVIINKIKPESVSYVDYYCATYSKKLTQSVDIKKITEEQKEKSQSIIRKWKETGLPEFPDDLSELSIKERK